jgi:beta-phosphoglucomutase family hydrolase
MTMIKAVIFDMDGVIIDSEPAHVKLENEIFKEYGIFIDEEEHNSFVGTTSHYMWRTIKNKYKLSQSLEELVENDRNRYFQMLSMRDESINIIDGIHELIKELHRNGIKMAIASSSPMNVIETVVNNFQLNEYFDILVTGDYVQKSKPEPDIFLYASKKIGIKPYECVVIEDSKNGSIAAKKAGMKCIGFKNPNSGNQDLSCADLVIDSLLQVDYEKIKML